MRLQPLNTDDFPTLRMAEFATLSGRWRTRGATPSLRHYEEVVSAGVHTQLLLLGARTATEHDELLGWCQLYNFEPDNGVGFVGLARFTRHRDPRFAIGIILFLQYLFDTCPLRKLYFEVPAYNEEAFQLSAHDFMREEGRMIERVFHGGDFVDVALWSLARFDWDKSESAALI